MAANISGRGPVGCANVFFCTRGSGRLFQRVQLKNKLHTLQDLNSKNYLSVYCNLVVETL
jgi:hypothetical protein